MPSLRPFPTSDASKIAHALNGRRSGHGWIACCPAHKEANPSFSISEGHDGRTLVHCFAGCSQDSVIDALKRRGLWNGCGADGNTTPGQYNVAQEQHARDAERIAQAVRVWDEAQYPRNTVAESYLASRKLSLPFELCDNALRFHPACPWESETVPCLIAAFRSIKDNSVTGIHRIRLDQPERWPKAERRMLGVVAGSAVKLDQASDRLTIGEGIETCMAARQIGFSPVWALGSAGGIENLTPVAGVDELIILGERDNGTSLKAAIECSNTWRRKAFVAMPPDGFKDFNDLLMERKDAAA